MRAQAASPIGTSRCLRPLPTVETRIVDDELGISSMERSAARFYGVFEHRYGDNFAGEPGISTHYIVLAYMRPPARPADDAELARIGR